MIETILYDEPIQREISSLTSEVMQQKAEIKSMDFTSTASTQAEKIISLLRRTASFARDNQRDDDPALIRHIYDTYYIQLLNQADIEQVVPLVTQVIAEDATRYGNQHPEYFQNSIDELRYGLQILEKNDLYETRFNKYVVPMVYSTTLITWQDAFNVFKSFAENVLAGVDKQKYLIR